MTAHRLGRRLPARVLALLLAAALAGGAFAPAGAAAAQHASLTVIERQVMCVTCKIPLNVAQSPQADRERAFIASLIAQGRSEAQIKQALVAQYGSSVLGLPADHGFDATVYLVPVAVVVLLAGIGVVLLPRWRRRTAAQEASGDEPAPMPAKDAARLDADLARFD